MKNMKQRALKLVTMTIWCAALLFVPTICIADVGEWTWMSGSNTVNQVGTYGTKGVPDPANVPGARSRSVSWTDSSGNLWLFGGNLTVNMSPMNDLWRYDPAIDAWTWISGANIIRHAGVYGTKGIPSVNNIPPCRMRSISWMDSNGNMWLFGGLGFDGQWHRELNDLWRYTPATNEWTWMSGSNTFEQVGTYGTKGVPDPANVPGARRDSISWTDSSGNFWLFGGEGCVTGASLSVALNDLWRYNPNTNEWTWVSGSNIFGQAGSYGIKGEPDENNVPGAREKSTSWTDSSGNLWLFGGEGCDSTGNFGGLNDLWRYDPETNEWTWVSGSDWRNAGATYGIKGLPDVTNVPGGRIASISWTDSADSLWLFGGSGFNDLWRCDPDTNTWTWISGTYRTGDPGSYGTIGTPDASNVPGGAYS